MGQGWIITAEEKWGNFGRIGFYWKSYRLVGSHKALNLQKIVVVSHTEAVRSALKQMVRSEGQMKEQRKQLCSYWWEWTQIMCGGYASVYTKLMKLVSWDADIFSDRYHGGKKAGDEEEGTVRWNAGIVVLAKSTWTFREINVWNFVSLVLSVQWINLGLF